MTEAFITPSVVNWARRRIHLTVDEAAQKLHIEPEVLAAWESGSLRPDMSQAEDLAQKLHIPFGYLFLSNPPTEPVPLPDLRTIGDKPPATLSPEFQELIYDVIAKQEWYKEYQEEEEATPIGFVGSFAGNDDVETIAADIRRTLGLTQAMRQSASDWEDFLRKFIAKTEGVGVLVLRAGYVGRDTHRTLDEREFRGFVISDPLAPLIFLNGRDAKAAQIFTLAHELAHVWRGQTGISDPDYRQSSDGSNSSERICNEIAAEVLIPKTDFVVAWTSTETIPENVRRLARRYRVSNIVVLRKALDTNTITRSEFQQYYDAIALSGPSKSEKGGGNYYNTLIARNSVSLTSRILSALAQGRTTYREASRLLDVKMTMLNSLPTKLFGGGTSIG